MRKWLAFPIISMLCMTAASERESDFIDLCELAGERTEFVAPITEIDEEIVTFATSEGDVVVFVEDNAQFLDEGETYRVVAVERRGVDAEWTSHVNGTCTVTEANPEEVNITAPDGSRLDTGWWRGIRRSYPVTQITIIILVVPTITLIGVTLNRVRFGADVDHYSDLPDSGEWVEFGDEDPEDTGFGDTPEDLDQA